MPPTHARLKSEPNATEDPICEENQVSGLPTVPNFVPSGRLDTFSRQLGLRAETLIFTSEYERIQTVLKC